MVRALQKFGVGEVDSTPAKHRSSLIEKGSSTVFSTIVVGTDGSPDAERALRAAAELAKLEGATAIHVVAAYTPLSPTELHDLVADLPEEFRDVFHTSMAAEARLGSATAILRSAGVEAMGRPVAGDPTDAILDVAEEQDADLIVVGSRGLGAAKRLLHGSVSTKVMHHAPCAVLVVRSDA